MLDLRDMFWCTLAVLLVVYLWIQPKWRLASAIPGYTGIPFFGVVYKFLGATFEGSIEKYWIYTERNIICDKLKMNLKLVKFHLNKVCLK